jgi:hypothetical protein
MKLPQCVHPQHHSRYRACRLPLGHLWENIHYLLRLLAPILFHLNKFSVATESFLPYKGRVYLAQNDIQLRINVVQFVDFVINLLCYFVSSALSF